jgi:hypothetical protein
MTTNRRIELFGEIANSKKKDKNEHEHEMKEHNFFLSRYFLLCALKEQRNKKS